MMGFIKRAMDKEKLDSYLNKVICGDSLEVMKGIPDNSIDLVLTDPPYGYSFMGKDWDKAVPSVETWKECLRILKPGAFCFVMSAPRQDVLSRMMVNLEDAGFRTDFTSIYWTYASGFPKAGNIGKMVDKRNGRDGNIYKEFADFLKDKRIQKNISQKEISKLFPSKTGGLTGCVWNWENGENVPTREQWIILKEKLDILDDYNDLIEREEAKRVKIGEKSAIKGVGDNKSLIFGKTENIIIDVTIPSTDEAKALDGSYTGYQPKPAVEVVIVCMKPLDQNTFVDQALCNRKGITWLDDCRVPYVDDKDKPKEGVSGGSAGLGQVIKGHEFTPDDIGRFPANLLVSDNILNDKISYEANSGDIINIDNEYDSRYFSLDEWDKQARNTYPFLIVPKASKSEKNKGCDDVSPVYNDESRKDKEAIGCNNPRNRTGIIKKNNHHPTVKPLKLMRYLITLATRENDIVIDPFNGSGTTCVASLQLNRQYIGIDMTTDYVEIARRRLSAEKSERDHRLL